MRSGTRQAFRALANSVESLDGFRYGKGFRNIAQADGTAERACYFGGRHGGACLLLC